MPVGRPLTGGAVAAGLCVLIVVARPAAQSPSAGLAARCPALMTLDAAQWPNRTTRLVTAAVNAASEPPRGDADVVPGTPRVALPEHCEISGRINERVGYGGQRYAINFHLRLPTTWNGRFFFQGGAGTNGVVGNAIGALQGGQPTVALALGYAVVSQDSGHDNSVNGDPAVAGPQTFGFDPDARLDFGYRSYDEVTRAAKAIIRQYYGRAAERSYFVGCSEGGREGMMISQRFPDAFDGILACAPGFRLPQAAVAQAFDAQAFAAVAREKGITDSNGHPFLNKTFSDEDLGLVANAVTEACDTLDGAADGMVQRFTACTTPLVLPKLTAITCSGPKSATCLTAIQVQSIVSVFDGARSPAGASVYSGWAWDVGIGGPAGRAFNYGWRSWKIGPFGAAQNSGLNVMLGGSALAAVFTTPPTTAPVASGGGAAFALGFDLDRDRDRLTATTPTYRTSVLDFMKADATDLSAFARHGGRLIIVQGVSDPVFSILDTIGWWTDASRVNRNLTDFVRLFPVPGMNHCSGGPSTDRFNAFDALVTWVERAVAPEQIIATAGPATPWPGRTRPLCVYPSIAVYSGRGSLDDAANFTCR